MNLTIKRHADQFHAANVSIVALRSEACATAWDIIKAPMLSVLKQRSDNELQHHRSSKQSSVDATAAALGMYPSDVAQTLRPVSPAHHKASLLTFDLDSGLHRQKRGCIQISHEPPHAILPDKRHKRCQNGSSSAESRSPSAEETSLKMALPATRLAMGTDWTEPDACFPEKAAATDAAPKPPLIAAAASAVAATLPTCTDSGQPKCRAAKAHPQRFLSSEWAVRRLMDLGRVDDVS